MHATIRRYDGVDQNRSVELTTKVNETLLPKLNKLPGFKGYYLIEADNGVFSSLNLVETPEQSMESTKFVATWIREENLSAIVPDTSGGSTSATPAKQPDFSYLGVGAPLRRRGAPCSQRGRAQTSPPVRPSPRDA